jgi:hypothetical protein
MSVVNTVFKNRVLIFLYPLQEGNFLEELIYPRVGGGVCFKIKSLILAPPVLQI